MFWENRVWSTEDYIYILKKWKKWWEALERVAWLEEDEVVKYLDKLVEGGEIDSWNFREWYDVPDFDYENIEIEDDEEDNEEDDEEDE